MAFTVPSALVSGNTLTATVYNQIRDSIIANSHAVFSLGGSRAIAISNGGGAKDAPEYVEFEVPHADYGGYVTKVVVEILTENATTTVTPKLRNITDSTDAVVGSAGTSTAWGTYQILTFTAVVGKKYRLMATKSNDTYQSWIIGHVRRTHA